MEIANPHRLGYQPALDGLRAVAVLLVVLHHLAAFLLPASYHDLVARGGFVGVDIFFVLSGFLITTLLLEERQATGRVRLGAFYVRRALRLFPALAVMLIVVLSVNATAYDRPAREIARSAAAVGLYAVNWVKIVSYDVLPGLGHTWSLAVEEQFTSRGPSYLSPGWRCDGRQRHGSSHWA